MMQNLTVKILIIFVISAILKVLSHMIFGGGLLGSGVGILIDISVLGYIYLVLRDYRYMNTKKIMMFLCGITVVSILVEIGVLSGDIGNLIILAVIAWMIFGRGGFFSGNGRFR